MAVTMIVAELAAALRLGNTAEETAEATRLLGYATEAVSRHLGDVYADVPAAVVNEAAVRLSRLFVRLSPFARSRDGYANALQQQRSGRHPRHRTGYMAPAPRAQPRHRRRRRRAPG